MCSHCAYLFINLIFIKLSVRITSESSPSPPQVPVHKLPLFGFPTSATHLAISHLSAQLFLVQSLALCYKYKTFHPSLFARLFMLFCCRSRFALSVPVPHHLFTVTSKTFLFLFVCTWAVTLLSSDISAI